MRIDFMEAVQSTGGINDKEPASSKLAAGSAVHGAPQDTARLSASGLEASALAAQALASGGLRTEKVEALREAVARGQYVLDPAAIARAMVNEAV